MKYACVFFCLWLVLAGFVFPQAGEAGQAWEFADYQSMRQRVGELFAQKNYGAAAAILKVGLEKFPDHLLANAFNLALSALLQNEVEKTIYWLEEGHRRGVFYSKWAFLGELWQPLAGHPRFQALLRENEARIAAAQKQASMKLELVRPEGFDPGRRYPLFIALHGGGENLVEFMPRWTSPRLQKEFVVAFVQSSQVADMKGFHWQEDAVTLRELEAAYRQIQQMVSVDPRRVYIGGFSSGGYGSMIALLAETIPVRGFVILCPELPADPGDARLAQLAKRKIRGTLLTTEFDRRLERQKAFVKRLQAGKLDVRLKVTPDIGHWYPDDLPRLIDEALRHMRR